MNKILQDSKLGVEEERKTQTTTTKTKPTKIPTKQVKLLNLKKI